MSKTYQPIGLQMTESKTELGRFIRAHRLQLRISQKTLAKKVGVPYPVMSKWELGRLKKITNSQVHALAVALNCEVGSILKLLPSKKIVIEPTTPPTTPLGMFILAQRKKLNLSMVEFAQKMKVTLGHAQRWEIGSHPTIRLFTAKKMAEVLLIDIALLHPFIVSLKKTTTPNTLGAIIQKRRFELKITTKQLAQQARSSRQLISKMERGESINMVGLNKAKIDRIASILKFDPEDFKTQLIQIEVKKPNRSLKQTDVGASLLQKRLNLGYTQVKLAKRSGVPVSAISAIERGWRKPNKKQMRKLTGVLN